MNENTLDALLIRLYHSYVFIPRRSGDEQMGLLYVGTAAREQGFRVEVLDTPNITADSLEAIVKERGVQVIGFYADHSNIFSVLSMIEIVKSRCPGVICVVGGPQAREWTDRILLESPCDVVVRGEGEIIFAALLKYYIYKQGDLSEIPGISWRNLDLIKWNPDPQPIDLDLYPIPNRALNPQHATPSGVENLVTGRGCPFRCTFCYEGRPEAQYRARLLDNVIEELEHLVIERQARYIIILDDVFMLNPNRVIKIANAIGNLRSRVSPDFVWFCEARADIICKRPDMLRACAEAGLARIQIGVETGSQKVLDAYNKKLRVEETLRAVELCNQAGVMSIIGNFIIGGAHESQETITESIAFAEQLLDAAPGRMEVTTTIFTPYPGTPMYHHPEQFGMKIFDPDCLTGPGDNYPFAATESLSKWEILDVRQRFVESVDKKIRSLLPQIPTSLIERHFKAYLHYDMRTRWFDFYCQFLNYYNYFGLTSWKTDIRTLERVPGEEMGEWKPLRTCFLSTTHEGNFIVNAGHRRIELSPSAGAVLELCGGRISVNRMTSQLQQTGIKMSEQELLAILCRLDEDRLVVFSRL